MGPRRKEERAAPTVAAAFLAYGAVFFDRLAPLFLLTTILRDLPVTVSLEGTLPLTVGLGWALAVPMTRIAARRLGDRDRLALGLVIAGVLGLASALTTSWLTFVLLRGIAGVFSGATAQPVTALSFRVSPRARWGLVTGFVQSAPRVGGNLLAPALIVIVAASFGWRAALATSAIVLLVIAALVIAIVPRTPPSDRVADALVWKDGGERTVNACAWASTAILVWLTTFSQAGIPLLIRWLDVTVLRAGELMSTFGAGAVLAAFLAPWSSDRIGRHGAVAVAGSIGSAAGGLLVALPLLGARPTETVVALLLLGAGVGMGALPLVMSAIPAESVRSGDVGLAMARPLVAGEAFGAALLPLAVFALVPIVGAEAVIAVVGVALFTTLVNVRKRLLMAQEREVRT